MSSSGRSDVADLLAESTPFVLATGLGGHGDRFEIRKDTAPLDYSATRAAFVIQQRDPEGLGDQQLVPGAVFQFASDGDGHVTPATRTSTSVWMGGLFTFKKTGDGSGQAATVIGELHAVGAVGYNELGGYQGTITNFASTNGTISALEFILKDSPDAGVTSFDTQMHSVNARIAKFNAGRARSTVAFFASSEGTVAPDALMAVNGTPAAPNAWQTGLDLSGASFGTGRAAVFPNTSHVDWLDTANNPQPVFTVDNANNVLARPTAAAGFFKVQTFGGGLDAIKVNGSTGHVDVNSSAPNIATFQANGVALTSVRNDGTLNFPSAVATLAVGAAGGGAAPPATPAQYLFVAVNGVNFRVPLYN